MKREDWKGLGASVALHLLLLLVFALVASTPEQRMLPGMVEVEFGPLESAQPAARAEEPRATPAQTEPRPRPEPQPASRQPQQTESPRLPTVAQGPDAETVSPPTPQQTEPSPEGRNEPQAPAAPPAPRDDTGGMPDATAGTTSATPEPGDAAARRAPFNIEGLDRTVHHFPLPSNPGARGTSVIAVCVGADGGVTSARPAMRTGTPALDNAALQAVRRWRFNALPPAAPQAQQCGRITFTFTLS